MSGPAAAHLNDGQVAPQRLVSEGVCRRNISMRGAHLNDRQVAPQRLVREGLLHEPPRAGVRRACLVEDAYVYNRL